MAAARFYISTTAAMSAAGAPLDVVQQPDHEALLTCCRSRVRSLCARTSPSLFTAPVAALDDQRDELATEGKLALNIRA